jgi:isopenicillin-N epimerase
VRYVRRELTAFSGLEPLIPDDFAWYAQMASLPLPPCDVGALGRWLYERYQIEIPVFAWKDRPLMRLSIQGYNTKEDADALLHALYEFYAKEGT